MVRKVLQILYEPGGVGIYHVPFPIETLPESNVYIPGQVFQGLHRFPIQNPEFLQFFRAVSEMHPQWPLHLRLTSCL